MNPPPLFRSLPECHQLRPPPTTATPAAAQLNYAGHVGQGYWYMCICWTPIAAVLFRIGGRDAAKKLAGFALGCHGLKPACQCLSPPSGV